MDQNFAVAEMIFIPQRKNTPRVSFAGDNDYRAVSTLFQTEVDRVQFVGGIDDRGVEYVDRFLRHTKGAKNSEITRVFAEFLEISECVKIVLLYRMREPNLSRVTVTVKPGSFNSTFRKTSGQNGDSVRRVNRIFAHEPIAKERKAEISE